MAYVQSFVLTKAMADFSMHMLWAEQIKNGVAVPTYVVAHAGWQVLLLLFNAFGLQFKWANLISLLLCEAITVVILLRWFWPSPNVIQPFWKTGIILLGISVAAPISIFWPLDHQFYLGYIGIVTYHNPTIIFLRPFAILQFVFSMRYFESRPISKLEILGMAIISMLATFAKPSFAICLIPALGILALYKIFQKKQVDLSALLIGFAVPTALVLVIQFLITYRADDSGGILFAPFAVMGYYSNLLLPKFLLSIVFPLLVTIVYRKQAWQDVRMILTWLIFIFGCVYTYFLAEGGSRFYDGNFTWSGEIALYVLFAVSTLFFLDMEKSTGKPDSFLRFIWLCHVGVGIIYFCYFIAVHVYV